MFNKVNICGIVHNIEYLSDNFNADMHLGQIHYDKCQININSALPQDLLTATLCHEITHGILIHIGREDLSNDETFVTCLGNAINQSFDIKYMEDEDVQ